MFLENISYIEIVYNGSHDTLSQKKEELLRQLFADKHVFSINLRLKNTAVTFSTLPPSEQNDFEKAHTRQ